MKKNFFHKIIQGFISVSLLISVSFFVSCEKKIDWTLQAGDQTFLIVDGILTNEVKHQKIVLSLSSQEFNQDIQYVSGAQVVVFDGENYFYFPESNTSPGTYLSEIEFAGVVSKVYSLIIEYMDHTFLAHAVMLPVSISNPLPYVQYQDSNVYYINSDIAVFNPEEAYMAEVLTDWSHVPGYTHLPETETTARQLFYHLKTIDVNQIFSPDSEPVLFPKGTTIIQKKYSLTSEHERFIRSLLAETHWHGGFFDLEEGNVYTNLSDGALGFFAACSVIADTSVVQ